MLGRSSGVLCCSQGLLTALRRRADTKTDGGGAVRSVRAARTDCVSANRRLSEDEGEGEDAGSRIHPQALVLSADTKNGRKDRETSK